MNNSKSVSADARQRGIVAITERFNKISDFSTITIIGDPGCDGLGASTMSTFAKALTAVQSEYTIIAGDIVHRGIEPLYAAVTDFVNAIAPNPVFMVCGNHDTKHYDEYFGLRNYVLYNDSYLFIILDNSTRKFSSDAVTLLEDALVNYERDTIVLLFHYPPPNQVCTNSVTSDDWEVIERIIQPYCSKIRYTISGHLHSYFEFQVDHRTSIVTGGGGARIEYINESIDKKKAHHHIVTLSSTGNGLVHAHKSLDLVSYTNELNDAYLKKQLEQTLSNEAIAHVRYKAIAENAKEKGFDGIAAMYEAFADSEYFHACNHLSMLSANLSIHQNLETSRANEHFEVHELYKDLVAYCVKTGAGLAKYVFFDSLEAEKIHESLVNKALLSNTSGNDIPLLNYRTCTSCGYTFAGNAAPNYCPVCGAPADKIRAVPSGI
jgi:rubrerythrin/predicted phosphodiesterase